MSNSIHTHMITPLSWSSHKVLQCRLEPPPLSESTKHSVDHKQESTGIKTKHICIAIYVQVVINIEIELKKTILK
jgi:hypothetical protein